MIALDNKTTHTTNGRFWFLLAIPFLLLAVGSASFAIFQPITVLPRITLAPGFNLINQAEERVSNEALRGQVTLYSFSYVDCAEECSQSGADIAAVRDSLAEALGNGRSPLQFVTISLDPEQDTPEKLSSFASQWAMDNNSIPWQWLTGDSQQVRYAVGGGFDLYYKAEENGRIQFQPRYVLVDRLGMIRARYFQAIPDTDILLRDINFLAEEAANSEGAQAIAYEAAHLFLCYPR